MHVWGALVAGVGLDDGDDVVIGAGELPSVVVPPAGEGADDQTRPGGPS